MSEVDAHQDDPLIGTVLADRYRLEKRLGHGGMGAVYLAQHVRMQKPFAVKVLHEEMSSVSEAVFRFQREALASGRVDHPHLVTATDFGELPDGSLYLVLEYIPGQSLGQVLETEGALSVQRALFITRQIAEALSAVHGANIVHRDLKPDNVMLVDRQGQDFVKLLDFGMAKVQVAGPGLQEVTRTGFVFGTPRYMAPEQAAGRATDHRSDLYSLGVVLYAMLAGKPPFVANDIREILRKQRDDPPPPLPQEIQPSVQAFVMKLLAKDPDARPQSALEVMEQADILLARTAHPRPRGAARVAAFARTPIGLAVIVLGVLGVFVAAFLWSQRHSDTVAVATPKGPRAALANAEGREIGDREVERLLVRAEVGDSAAWKALEKRSDALRSAKEWFVLGSARFVHEERLGALEAYLRAVDRDPRYGKNWRVLRHVFAATDDAATWQRALSVAAALPGSEGADILFHVWASTPKVTAKTEQAKKLLETDGVRHRASEAVRVALDLRNVRGEGCEARRDLLPRVIEHGDARSLLPLLKMASRKGCGPRGKDDCFECLRDDPNLERAIESAKSRLPPDYSKEHPPVGHDSE